MYSFFAPYSNSGFKVTKSKLAILGGQMDFSDNSIRPA